MKNKNFLTLAFTGIMVQIVLMTWLCSGTRIEYIFPMSVTGTLSFVFASFWDGVQGRVPSPFEKTVFYCGGAVIIIAVIQYLNPSAEFINVRGPLDGGPDYVRKYRTKKIT